MSRIAQAGPIHLGLDVHRDSISVATLHPDQAAADIQRIPHDEAAVLQFIGRLPSPPACGRATRPDRLVTMSVSAVLRGRPVLGEWADLDAEPVQQPGQRRQGIQRGAP